MLTSFLFLTGTECLLFKIEIHSGFLFLHFQILIISDSLFNPRERPLKIVSRDEEVFSVFIVSSNAVLRLLSSVTFKVIFQVR